MNHPISRTEAIRLLAKLDVERLTPKQRAEQFPYMMGERADSYPGWETIPEDIQLEFASAELHEDPASSRYDPVLILALSQYYRGTTNFFLLKQLQQAAYQVTSVEGEVEALSPCPCCGYCTLEKLNSWEICSICWWEDDGQDTPDADQIYGGPNARLSLTQARINFLQEGISNPQREDLRKLQAPLYKYPQKRVFRLVQNNATGVTVIEINSNIL